MKTISKKFLRRITAISVRMALRSRLRNTGFSVVSNNCWGGHIHQLSGTPYKSPFVGLFLEPECYLNLLKNFHQLVRTPLMFAETSKYPHINASRAGTNANYPIGLLGTDVELHFVHYQTKAEAASKWNRRLGRMETDENKLFFKFCDRDGCTPRQLAEFDALRFPHKVCFVSRPCPSLNSAVYIPGCAGGQVPDGRVLGQVSPLYFDAVAWLKGKPNQAGWPRWFRFV